MDRLQKRCVFASTGVHLLLVLILFVGPAFLSAPKKSDTIQELTFTFIPDIVTANGPSGGGHPTPAPPVQTPAPTPRPPVSQPKAEPEKTKQPDPPKDTKAAKLPKADPDSLEVKQPKLSAENLKPVTRSKTSNKAQKKTATSSPDDQEQKLADQRRQIAQMIKSAASGINASSATKIEIHSGPGGGGPTYASYASLVQMKYWDAWAAPEDGASESAVVDVSITIRSDGTIISSRIIKRSGDGAVDASVERVLARVTSIGRDFPEGMNEKQHTYTLHFDLKAKKGLA